jgi:hypothetical protein
MAEAVIAKKKIEADKQVLRHVSTLFDNFIKDKAASGIKNSKEYEYDLRSRFEIWIAPRIGGKDIAAITKSDLLMILDDMKVRKTCHGRSGPPYPQSKHSTFIADPGSRSRNCQKPLALRCQTEIRFTG